MQRAGPGYDHRLRVVQIGHRTPEGMVIDMGLFIEIRTPGYGYAVWDRDADVDEMCGTRSKRGADMKTRQREMLVTGQRHRRFTSKIRCASLE